MTNGYRTAESKLDELITLWNGDVDDMVGGDVENRTKRILLALKPCIELLERDTIDSELMDDTENYDYEVKSKLLKAIIGD